MSQEERRRADRAHPDPESAQQAERCRRLSQAVYDRTISEMLSRMADDYEKNARSDSAG